MMVQNLLKDAEDLYTGTVDQVLEKLLTHVHARKKDDQKLLVCLDNAEDLIASSRKELVQFLDKMMSEIPNLYVLITSRTQIGFCD
jgi:hypothetical protein